MAQDIVAGPIGEMRVASTTSGGTALTTTASFTSFFRGTSFIRLMPRNVVTAVVIRYALNPWLSVLKTTDALAAVANLTDASENLQDNDTATTLSMNSFDTAANNNYLYVGSHIPFRGARTIIGNTNGTASVLTVKYWKNDDTWADTSATDGTASGGATLAQTGNVSWTLPTDWKRATIADIGDTTIAVVARPSILVQPLFWTRWEVSVALDATVTITGMQAMNRSTTYDELDVSLGAEMRIRRGLNGVGCIEHLTDAGTANLIVSCGALGADAKLAD